MNKAEALEKSLEYFNGDKLAAGVFVDKYALTTPEGDVLEATPDEMHKRLAKEFARIEKKYPNPMSEEEIYNLLKDFKYVVPQGSPMAGIGNPYQITSLSNCFVLSSPSDSYGSILRTDTMLVQTSKRRGGIGIDISNIRPINSSVNNAAKTSTGIGPFMERYSNSIREVGQSGRRGAAMLTISVHHPEIETFINIKRDLKKVTGANISIRLSDEFMKAVKNDENFELRFPVDSKNPKIKKQVKAKHVWDQIVDAAWSSAEPGLLFWDAILKGPADAYARYRSRSTNPCSELPLSEGDSCRLLVVNLVSFVKNQFEKLSEFDFVLFEQISRKAQRLMDDMVDLELESVDKIINKILNDPESEEDKRIELALWQNIRQTCADGRRTGLGITALGDTLAALGIRYGSKESISMTEEIYKTLALAAYKETVNMAKERGAFKDFDLETEKKWESILKIISLDKNLHDDWMKYGRRNVSLTTTAPVGSVSTMTQTTSGIEPAFEVVYRRRRKINAEDGDVKIDFVDQNGDKWQEYEVYHHQYKKWMEISGDSNIENSPYWKARANDVDWLASINVQAAAQKWCDHAISKTCNLPNSASKELVSEIYMKAWESGCKGFTVYRDGCRDGVLLANSEKKEKKTNFETHNAPKRPAELPCEIATLTVNGEKWTFFVGLLEGKPYEIMGGLSKFVTIPKRVKKGKIVKITNNNIARYDFHYDFENGPEHESVIKDISEMFENATNAAFTRTISLAMRHGAPIHFLIEQLLKGSEKDDDLFSFSRAVTRVLKQYIQDGTKASDKICSNCGGSQLVYQEGCQKCLSCGTSKCG